MQNVASKQAVEPDLAELREQARAWYTIRYDSIVEAVESVLLEHATARERPVSVRAFVHGRLQILVQSAYLNTDSHMYIRDVGGDFADVCGGSMAALTALRLVLTRTLIDELPPHLVSSIGHGIEQMITEVLWGYARSADEAERAIDGEPPITDETAYDLDAGWYKALVAQAPYGVAVFHAVNGDLLAGNDRLVEMFGYSLAEFDHLPNDQIYTTETPEDDFDKGVELMAGTICSFSRETAWRHKDGQTVWCEMTNWVVRNADSRPEHLVCIFVPLDENRERETHWQRADKRFRYLAQLSVDPTFIAGVDNVIRYASPSTERTLGIDPDALVGSLMTDLVLKADQERFRELHGELTDRPRHTARMELRLNRRDGQWGWFELTAANLTDVPEVEGYSFQARDVSDRKLVEQLLAQQALFDPLTNLLNRRGMLERLERALQQGGSSGATLSVLYIDLDDFKQVNDTYGHEAGDEALLVAAGRLASSVGTSGIVARWGGDEFVVVIEQSTPDLERTIVARILGALAEPIDVGAGQVTIRASIGAATSAAFDDADLAPMALLREADSSMYLAKTSRPVQTATFRRRD